ncbi:hypothetical protein ACWU4D_15875 [Vibrio sp. WJH972]
MSPLKYSSFNITKTQVLLLASGALSISTSVFSSELDLERFRVHGFGTVAITQSGNDEIYTPDYLSRDISTDKVSWDESLFGLQLDSSITDSLEASVQLVFRNRYDDDLEENIERAFLKYSPNEFYARIGRLGLDVYMLSEYRNVGYAYPWAHASLEFYGAFGMDYYDGAEIGYRVPTDLGHLQVSLYGGSTTQTSEMAGYVVKLDYESLVGTTLRYSQDNWTLHAALANATLASDVDFINELRDALDQSSAFWNEADSISSDLEVDGTSVTYASLGGLYDNGDWVAQSELSYADTESKVFPTFYTGYLSVARRLESITPFILGGFVEPVDDRSISSNAPVFLSSLQDAVSSIYSSTFDQKSLSVGASWDVVNNLSLTVQWDRTWVEPYGGELWNFDSVNTTSVTLDTYSLNCSFIF